MRVGMQSFYVKGIFANLWKSHHVLILRLSCGPFAARSTGGRPVLIFVGMLRCFCRVLPLKVSLGRVPVRRPLEPVPTLIND